MKVRELIKLLSVLDQDLIVHVCAFGDVSYRPLSDSAIDGSILKLQAEEPLDPFIDEDDDLSEPDEVDK